MTEHRLAECQLRGPVRADSCRLYLVRHGTTLLGAPNRYRGRRDIPLDARGYRDAVGTAASLAAAGLTAVYVGPLRRAMATAQIIADEAEIPDIRVLAGLNNLDYGAWEGMTAQEAELLSPEAFAAYRSWPGRAACPDGERLVDAQQRILAAVRLIGSRHRGEAVAAVTHAVMIRLALIGMGGIPEHDWRVPMEPVTELHASRGAIRLGSVADSRPLPSSQF